MQRTNGKASRVPDAGEEMTRAGVAKILGTSLASVRRMEDAKILRPRIKGGVHYFDPAQVNDVKQTRGASSSSRAAPLRRARDLDERAAQSWEMFAAGKTVLEVVLATRIHPDEATRLAAMFASPSHVILPPELVRELASLGFGDAAGVVSASTLLDAAKRLRARVRELRSRNEKEPGQTLRGGPAQNGERS